MGLLSWWRGQGKESNKLQSEAKPTPKPSPVEVPGMNGAVAVPGSAADLTVFEFGSVAAANSQFTMSGYCPVSDDLEPCVWQLDPVRNPKDPLFRVVF